MRRTIFLLLPITIFSLVTLPWLGPDDPGRVRPAFVAQADETPTVPTETPTVPTETPTVPTETPTVPTEMPTVPTEPPTVPTEMPTVPTESPTDTPGPMDTATPTESSPTATATPFTPTITSTPERYVKFWADDTKIGAGSCTKIRWETEHVKKVLFDGRGVSGDGSHKTCPCANESHVLDVTLPDDTHDIRYLTIKVSGTCAAPTTAPKPAPTSSAPAATAVWRPSSEDLVAGPPSTYSSDDEAWSDLVNISRSGAAGQPRIVAADDGKLQVFWWDVFHGLITTYFDGEAWSDPEVAPIRVSKKQGDKYVLEDIGTMPTMVADGLGWVHAFWLGPVDKGTGVTPLMHSRMRIGERFWPTGAEVAESAIVYDVAVSPSGGLTLAYVRGLHTAAYPAGVYVKRTSGGASGWGAPAAIYGSIYFRSLTGENAHVFVADAGEGVIHLGWDDPRLGLGLYARSTDGGLTWTEPESLGDPEELPARVRVFALPGGGVLRLWEATGMGGCTLYQQEMEATEALTATWSAPRRVLEGVTACPRGEQTWQHEGRLLWLWGENTGTLQLAAWDGEADEWSEPRALSFRVQDPETERWADLDSLRVALNGGTLAVAGSDPAGGEVWVTEAVVDALELVFAPPSPWAGPFELSLGGGWPGLPAVAADAEGRVHVLWSQSPEETSPGETLYYVRGEGIADDAVGDRRWTESAGVLRSPSGRTEQPSLTAAGDLLHAVWSGGYGGEVFYSRAYARDAQTPGGWSKPWVLPMPGEVGSWPAILADRAGVLHVVYAVPVNEWRGIYYTTSDDGGETWSEARTVFDAEAAGWVAVDRPSLAVDADGGLHAAWMRGTASEPFLSQGIFYARSTDGGATWSEPVEMAAGASGWPVVVATLTGQVHLVWGQPDGGWYHRWSGDGGWEWTSQQQVGGFGGVIGPVGLAAGGDGTLYLAGLGEDDAGRAALVYATWSDDRWSEGEGVRLDGDGSGLGVAVALQPALGQLDVAWPGEGVDETGTTQPGVLYAGRVVPAADVPPAPARTPQPTVTPTPLPVVTPTPRPTVDTEAPPQSPPTVGVGGFSLPLLAFWGVILGVLLIAGVLGVRAVRNRGR